MNTIERTLIYDSLYLVNNDLDNIKEYQLPDGFKFVFFNDGNEKAWVEIEKSSGEFLSFEEGIEAFNHYYGSHYEELKKLCLFIENENGEKVATSTAFYLNEPIGDITGNVHWVAIKKEYQGMHLSKPLISETLKQMRKLGHKKTLLHTQTHTWLAVKVYLDMGFIPYEIDKHYLGWKIIKKLTNHEILKDVDNIDEKDMYNDLYCQAYNFLKNYFNEPFNYKVWDEKGPVIGVNTNEKLHYFMYKYNDKKLEIVGENDEYRKFL